MNEILHFKSQAERLRYLRGEFEEIKPIEVSKDAENAVTEPTEPSEAMPVGKNKKGKKKDDKVQTK